MHIWLKDKTFDPKKLCKLLKIPKLMGVFFDLLSVDKSKLNVYNIFVYIWKRGSDMKKNLLCYFLAFILVASVLMSAGVFSVNAAEKSIAIDKTVYRPTDKISITVSGATGNDWVGVYPAAILPGTGTASSLWTYVGDLSSADIYINGKLENGQYIAYLLENDGYTILDSVSFSVAESTFSLERTTYSVGMSVTAFHTNASGKDWVGLYNKGSVPQSGNPALVWAYVGSEGYTVINLNTKFSTGEYTAYLCANDGYTVIASCDFSVVEKTLETPDAPLSVEFVRSKTADPGFSEGTVYVSVDDEKTDGALLYWGNADGVLSDYTYFGYAPYNAVDKKCVYEVTQGNLIPEQATRIYAFAVSGTHYNVLKRNAKYSEVSVYTDISVETYAPGEPLYTFEVISDLHVTGPGDGQGHNDNGRFNNDRVISAFSDITANRADTAGVMVVGDLTNYGKDAEYEVLGGLVSEYIPEIPMYYTIGNHAFYARGESAGFEESWKAFRDFAGWSEDDGYYRYFVMNGDYFIFMGTEGYLDGADTAWGYYSEAQREWLRGLLEKASATNSNAFVFMHQSIEETVSGSFKSRGQYWDGINDDELMREVIESYENTFLFTGHSHWNLNSYGPFINGKGEGANYYNTASAGYLWGDDDMALPGSEGLHVEVYADGVIVKGRDFEAQKWIPNVNTYAKKKITSEAAEILGITSIEYDESRECLSTEFVVPGVQIRTDDPQGLRFTAYLGKDVLEKYSDLNSDNKTNLSKEDTGIGYGFVVLPHNLLGDAKLEKSTSFAKIVPAEVLFSETDEYIAYTAVIIGIDIENYKLEYTAIPYITYKDADGIEHTFYGEQYTANVYETAAEGVSKETNPEIIAALQAVMAQYDSYVADTDA